MDDAQRDPREFLSRVLYHPISDCKRVRSSCRDFSLGHAKKTILDAA